MDPHLQQHPGRRERRTQARRTVCERIGLEVRLVLGPGQAFTGRVLDTSAGGVRIAPGRGAPLRFFLGTRLEVHFAEPGETQPLVLEARVANQETRDELTTLGLRFVDDSALGHRLEPQLWRQFNRRRRPRVQLRADSEPLEARIEGPDHAFSARVTDLSALGLGILVSGSRPAGLTRRAPVRVRIPLPGEPGAIELIATEVHGAPTRGGARHGLRFDRTLMTDSAASASPLERLIQRVKDSAGGRAQGSTRTSTTFVRS